MKSAVETLNPTRVKLTIEVPYEELKPSLDAALKAIASQIHVPGFRPGKVPTRLVEQRVGKGAVLQEAVNDSLPQFYGQAVEEAELRPLGQPEVDIVELPVDEGDQFVFTAEVDVRPQIELPVYEELKVEVAALDDASIEKDAEERMTALRQRFGALNVVDRAAQDGDFVTIDLTATIDGEEIDSVKGISYEIGSGNLLEGMDAALIGMKVDETNTFTAPLAGGEHEGEDSEITVTLGSVKERELPELDDDFAQEASEFDTLEELRTDIAKQARQAKLFAQGVEARDKVLDLLLETITVEVPESLVEAEVQGHLQNHDGDVDDEHRAEVREGALKALRAQLLLDAIAEAEKIQVEQQELIEYLVMTAQQYGMEPAQFAQAMEQNNQVPAVVAEVARRKGLAAILETVQVVDTNGDSVDLGAVIETDDIDVEEAEAEAAAHVEAEKAETKEEKPAEESAEKQIKKAAKKKAPAKKKAESGEDA
ncbi:trigger factor [Austwickia chelonae]|uniref:Trigger factor n=1 Tax=Austwickia chelonae NBRC 105200 TaxID=1184607 RepID=K6ULM8_9MICO|nr:trigger factor [Austwickia chelonae]GAB77386.1 trigger factor [Austwickia chelonae NBRC 105200]